MDQLQVHLFGRRGRPTKSLSKNYSFRFLCFLGFLVLHYASGRRDRTGAKKLIPGVTELGVVWCGSSHRMGPRSGVAGHLTSDLHGVRTPSVERDSW